MVSKHAVPLLKTVQWECSVPLIYPRSVQKIHLRHLHIDARKAVNQILRGLKVWAINGLVTHLS